MTRHGVTTFLLSLALGFGSCKAASSRAHDDSSALEGCWEGTYYQCNLGMAYPMELVFEEAEEEDLHVTLRWPTVGHSETRGRASVQDLRVAWTEDELVRGGNLVLGGHYRAAFVAPDTLAGVYHNESRGEGFFTLARVAHAEGERQEIAAQRAR